MKSTLEGFTITETVAELTEEERKVAERAALYACIDMVQKHHEKQEQAKTAP